MDFMKRKPLDPQQYNQHFYSNSQSIRAGPVPNQNRSCNDICCLITFVLIIIAAIVIGAIMINDGRPFYSEVFNKSAGSDMSGLAAVFSTQGGIIVGMFFFSIALAVIFLLLLKFFPKCMIYTMIGLIFCVFAALIVFGIINQIWWMVITFAITLAITACLLFCFRDRIATGIVLLRVATTFLSEKPTAYLSPLYPLFFGILFFVFWVAAIVAQLYYLDAVNQKNKVLPQNKQISTSKENAFIVVWIILFVFMAQFLYYVQTFLIGTCCAYWYYGIQANYCTRGVWTLNRFHIGSLTFGALLITILNFLKRVARQESNQQCGEGNIVAGICLCLVACCLACIEDLVNTLNHNAYIVMTVTGESYINSAKTALSLIFENFGVFYIVDFFSDLINFFGILVSVGIPTLVGFLIIRYGREASTYQASYAAVAIFFMSILIAGLIITMIGEAMSCVFIFYCFDKKFRSMGIVVPNSPPAIQQFLAYGEGGRPYGGPYNPGTDQQLRERPY